MIFYCKCFMYRILLLLALTLAYATAMADDFTSMKFTSIDGSKFNVSLKDLEITFAEGKVVFNNSPKEIPLSTLVSMEFSYEEASVTDAVASFECPVEVISLQGYKVGTFYSCSEAIESLSEGIYLVTNPKGNSIKINVK